MSKANPGPEVQDLASEEQRARELAARYRCEFIRLHDHKIDPDLFRSIPVDWMFRYNFVPLQMTEGGLEIAMADPSQLMMIDEVSLLLDRRLLVRVATLAEISDYLKKTQQSQRVLEEATEGFTLDIVRDEENGEETSHEFPGQRMRRRLT